MLSGRCNQALCLKNKERGQLNVNDLFIVRENYFIVPLRCGKYARNQINTIRCCTTSATLAINNFSNLYILHQKGAQPLDGIFIVNSNR